MPTLRVLKILRKGQIGKVVDQVEYAQKRTNHLSNSPALYGRNVHGDLGANVGFTKRANAVDSNVGLDAGNKDHDGVHNGEGGGGNNDDGGVHGDGANGDGAVHDEGGFTQGRGNKNNDGVNNGEGGALVGVGNNAALGRGNEDGGGTQNGEVGALNENTCVHKCVHNIHNHDCGMIPPPCAHKCVHKMIEKVAEVQVNKSKLQELFTNLEEHIQKYEAKRESPATYQYISKSQDTKKNACLSISYLISLTHLISGLEHGNNGIENQVIRSIKTGETYVDPVAGKHVEGSLLEFDTLKDIILASGFENSVHQINVFNYSGMLKIFEEQLGGDNINSKGRAAASKCICLQSLPF